MAQKRMFDRRVVESDKFTDLPNSSKALYFLAGMSADDKGFFQPRRLQKMHGFTEDDFKILIAKGYFITFESGVVVITDWNKNNWLDSRRVTETEYIEELKLLKLINDKYELKGEEDFAKQTLSENSIEENSIEESRMAKEYENEIGMLTPYQAEILFGYLDDLSEEMIIEAIHRASKRNKKNLAYIEGILKSWISQGYKTISDIEDMKRTNGEKSIAERIKEATNGR